jgi:hypothetical protein
VRAAGFAAAVPPELARGFGFAAARLAAGLRAVLALAGLRAAVEVAGFRRVVALAGLRAAVEVAGFRRVLARDATLGRRRSISSARDRSSPASPRACS